MAATPALVTTVLMIQLIARALSVFAPTLVIAYAVFGAFLVTVALLALPVIVSANDARAHVLAQLLYTPQLAGSAVWVGIAVSTRSTEARAA